MKLRSNFPHAANGVLSPVRDFIVNGRFLCLYRHTSRPQSAPYSLYWEDESNPVQHAMNDYEVFNTISYILREVEEKRLARSREDIELD